MEERFSLNRLSLNLLREAAIKRREGGIYVGKYGEENNSTTR